MSAAMAAPRKPPFESDPLSASGGHADAAAFELRMSQPLSQSQDLVRAFELAEPLNLTPLSQGITDANGGDFPATQSQPQASQPLVADRAPPLAAGAASAARFTPPAGRAAAIVAETSGAGPRGAGPSGRGDTLAAVLGGGAVGGGGDIPTAYPVKGTDALPGGVGDVFQGLSDVELEALRGLQKLLPEEFEAAAAAAVAASGVAFGALQQAKLAGFDGSAALALLGGAPQEQQDPEEHQQRPHHGHRSGGKKGKGQGQHPSLRKAEHRMSRATRRGPMDEMRQLMRILTKLLTADNGVRQVLVEDQVGPRD
jgi:hypothetical protein